MKANSDSVMRKQSKSSQSRIPKYQQNSITSVKFNGTLVKNDVVFCDIISLHP